MTNLTRSPRAVVLRLSALGVIGLSTMMSCGNDVPVAPKDDTLSLQVVSGNSQSGVVNTELAQPLQVKVTNSNGNIVPNQVVTFHVTSGGGSMYSGTGFSNNKGIVEDYWTLGTSTKDSQKVEVRAVLATGQKQVYGTFTATPLAGPATQIAVQAGNGQTAYDLTAVAVAPAVQLADQYSNPVNTSGVSVTFVPAAGSGSVTNGTVSTGVNGLATVGWTLGALTGQNSSAANTLTATAASLSSSVTFTATSIGNSWTTKASMPTARYGLAAASGNGILYAVGGDNGGSVRLPTMEAYDPTTDTWTTKASMPTAREWLGVASINGFIYAVGGHNNGGFLTTVEAYDPTTDTWTTKAPMPTARFALGVAAINGILYAVGGYNNSPLTTVEAYDPVTDTWTTKASMSTAHVGLAVASVKGILYAVGGGNNSGFLATVEAYDPTTDTWTTKASMPTARNVLAVASVNGILYAVGGRDGSARLPTVEAYDPTTDTWTTKASMPTAREWLGAAAINGILYAVGGYGSNGFLTTVEAYHP